MLSRNFGAKFSLKVLRSCKKLIDHRNAINCHNKLKIKEV